MQRSQVWQRVAQICVSSMSAGRSDVMIIGGRALRRRQVGNARAEVQASPRARGISFSQPARQFGRFFPNGQCRVEGRGLREGFRTDCNVPPFLCGRGIPARSRYFRGWVGGRVGQNVVDWLPSTSPAISDGTTQARISLQPRIHHDISTSTLCFPYQPRKVLNCNLALRPPFPSPGFARQRCGDARAMYQPSR
jgi:hypothetical protein